MRRYLPGLAMLLCAYAQAWEADGIVDLRAVHSDTASSWTKGGLGKQRYDADHDGLRLGQALLDLQGDLADTVGAHATLGADDDRRHLLDLNEAYLRWQPVPTSAWRTSIKAGAFFAPFSLENDGPGWTTTRTLSASAIDSWIGEELRTKGVQLDIWRPGRFVQSMHDIGFTLAAFQGNEAAGALLAYRGWGVGDRITGLNETLRLANIPIFGAGGALPPERKVLDPFHQVDGRTGYYAGGRYGYGNLLGAAAYHYDNRADPLAYGHDQWGWHTRFDTVNLRLTPSDRWEVLAQWLGGDTQWGRRLTRVNYGAWYVLAGYHAGPDGVAVRYDRFHTAQDAFVPSAFDEDDYYGETGHALSFSYRRELRERLALVAEWTGIDSQREARELIGQAAAQRERTVSLALRWQF